MESTMRVIDEKKVVITCTIPYIGTVLTYTVELVGGDALKISAQYEPQEVATLGITCIDQASFYVVTV